MMPASTMKLVTTYAGLSILGPDYRWRTSAYSDGTLDANGVLHGNLYIQGTGDPKLVPEELIDLVEKIHKAGIRGIDGALVLDKRYFDPSTRDLPAFDDDANAPYNVGPDPLLYAFKSLSFTLTPSPDGTVAIDVLPALAQLQIDNQMRAVNGPCRGEAASVSPTVTPTPERHGRRVVRRRLFGALRPAHDQRRGARSFGVLRGRLPCAVAANRRHVQRHDARRARSPSARSSSPRIRGRYCRTSCATSTSSATTRWRATCSCRSARLKKSRPPRPPNRPARSRPSCGATASTWNILTLDNGSGLSRDEHITALSLADLLQRANASPVAQVFVQSLPIAGVDGTMRNRLTNRGAGGNAQIKTGTLRDVRAIAGYVASADGNSYVVVSFINDPHSEAARAAHDALLEWVYQGPGHGLQQNLRARRRTGERGTARQAQEKPAHARRPLRIPSSEGRARARVTVYAVGQCSGRTVTPEP